jgi:ABC-type Fe3+-siderophore transport system permease subunit
MVLFVLYPGAPIEVLPVAAFIGAFIAYGIVYLAAWQGGLSTMRLALVGVAMTAACAGAIYMLIVVAKLRVAQAVVWLAGSTYARGWDELARLAIFPLVLLPLAWVASRWLDYLALGDDQPRSLGIPLERARILLTTISVALAAAAVATVGTISFVGLLGPHTARLLVGSRHRRLLPLAALFGGALVLFADTVGRTILAPKEIPSGLVTAILGTPYFLWLLWRGRVGRTG